MKPGSRNRCRQPSRALPAGARLDLQDKIGQIRTALLAEDEFLIHRPEAVAADSSLDGALAVPVETRPAEEQQFSLALDDPVVAAGRAEAQPDPVLSRSVADGLIDLVATALSGETRQDLPEFVSSAFLREVARLAAEEGVELSEDDYIHLLNEAAAVEMAVHTAEHVRGSLESCLGKVSARDTFTFGATEFLDGGRP